MRLSFDPHKNFIIIIIISTNQRILLPFPTYTGQTAMNSNAVCALPKYACLKE